MNTKETRTALEQKRGQQKQILKDIEVSLSEQKRLSEDIKISEEAQMIIMAVAEATQKELEYRIVEPVNLAQAAIYDDPYKMVADFKITGKGVECRLGFKRNDFVIKPLEGSGGGPIDIASFSLIVSSWSLAQPRSRPVLIFDEPFRFVSRDKISLVGKLLKEVSSKLGIQIIIISHIKEIIESADKIIYIENKNNMSKVSDNF